VEYSSWHRFKRAVQRRRRIETSAMSPRLLHAYFLILSQYSPGSAPPAGRRHCWIEPCSDIRKHRQKPFFRSLSWPQAISSISLSDFHSLAPTGKGDRFRGHPVLDLIEEAASSINGRRVSIDGNDQVVRIISSRVVVYYDPPTVRGPEHASISLVGVERSSFARFDAPQHQRPPVGLVCTKHIQDLVAPVGRGNRRFRATATRNTICRPNCRGNRK
jgi:hypothetical protein